MSIYAIGDVQGCYDELQRLLDKLKFDPTQDKLWFAGDIINRGPKSLKTIRFVKSLGDNATTVLGNHDLHLLAIANGRGKQGKKDTINKILKADDREELLHWLLHRPLMHYDNEHNISLTHAGIYPLWSIDEAISYAAEIESVLRGDKSHEFFHHMYGDKPKGWSNHLKGWDRLRFITNAFTRMRYCDLDGHLLLRDKGKPGNQPDGVIPWFNHPGHTEKDCRVVFGHWSTLANPEIDNLYPIDTGCLWGGKLTALKINRKLGTIKQVDCPQNQPVDNKHRKKTGKGKSSKK
ncbi:MAG: symmetrical bis(5'-nucleosyl)-tetraphosphatase [Gammaproteobacteria bacterium]|nr:symmetrical bis(5'-nucleosyl)-tetraphosphatase [Gammaproteobacteria bacterium]